MGTQGGYWVPRVGIGYPARVGILGTQGGYWVPRVGIGYPARVGILVRYQLIF